jgi:hypothetical protein
VILAIVTFKLRRRWTVEEAAGVFESTATKYAGKRGLVRKHYYVTDAGDLAGAVYLWRSRADADACYTPEWDARVTEKYGVHPEILFASVPVSVDNVAGVIERA